MTTQPVEANVVLTSDNSQYDQAMMASAGSTDQLGKSLDSLGQKISNLTKAAGKTLIGISAADVALIGSATAAWASYEKQMSRLQAQSAILARTNTQQERVMKDYTSAVKGLRTEYGTTTAEASKLVEVLSKVTNVRETRKLSDLSKVFVDMSQATGESSEGLASSLTNLQKIMGAPINTKTSRDYADTFTYLSAQTQTSAQGLIDFAAQIAPMGEQMGMNTKQVAGFAAGFARVGQEGFAAATVFNKATGDITKAIATGGPQLKQYANIVDMSVESFSNLSASEQVLRIFEALNAQGTAAASTLERLGLEGPRTQKAIAAINAQPGGLRGAVTMAESPAAAGAAAEGAEAAMRGLSDEFGKLREEMRMLAESMATIFGPAVAGFVGGIEKIAENVNEVMSGPFGELIQGVMALVAPLAGGAGAMLLFAGAILKVAAAMMVWRNSASLGVREGMQGFGRIGGGGDLGPRGAQLATDPRSSWLQRGMYNAGQPIGALFSGGAGYTTSGYQAARARFDPNYMPGPQRSLLSYAAGGLGRGIESFLTPQFDQMRFANPAARRTWLANQSPFARRADRQALAVQMGEVGEAETTLRGAREEQAALRRDPFMDNATRAAKEAELKATVTETKERLNSARAAERMTREHINSAEAARVLARESRSTSTGFTRLSESARGLGAGAVGGVMGAGRAGIGAAGTGISALMRSGMGANIAGGVGMAGMAAAGVESNMLMFGALGTTIMPGWGTAIGAVAGAGLDMAAANDKVSDSIKNVQEQATEYSQSGVGLTSLAEAAKESQKDLDQTADDWKITSAKFLWDPSTFLGSTKNFYEGMLWGDSDLQEMQANQDKANKMISGTEETVRALAEASGYDIKGTAKQQIEQLDEFMATEGAARLKESGIDLEGLIAQRAVEELFGGALGGGVVAEVAAPGLEKGLAERLTAIGGVGAGISEVSKLPEGDIALFYKTTQKVFDTAVASGQSYLEIMRQAEQAQQEIGVENSREFEASMELSRMAQQRLALQAPELGRVGTYKQTLAIGQTLAAIEPTTATDVAELDKAKMANLAAVGDMMSYFRQMLLAQDQYELQRSRAQEDYHEQRMYQEQDYAISRERAEESFARMRNRSVANFARQQERAYYQFNLSRSRAEEDFNHQVAIQAKQQAMSVYDIYQRVQTERTSSIEWVIANAKDQVRRINEQTANLDVLRGRGVTDTAIQQLGLTDPAKAQQLARIVSETVGTQGQELIAQINAVSLEKVRGSKDLVTDPSSLQWQEMERGFRKSMTRGAEDFDLQMRQSKQDFNRGLKEQRTDFNIMMEQQAEDYDKGMNRQERAYKKSMDRSAEDMANMANEILLTNEQVLIQSQERLTGAAQKQARQVARSLKKLSTDTKPEAVKFMTELAAIYGFEYTIPKGAIGGLASEAAAGAAGAVTGALPNFAQGGVMPGWSPGRDDRMVAVSGGEAIMRPEWARAVGESAINAMNHAARHGGFAEGGIPAAGDWTRHTSGYPWARWAGDINVPGSSDYGDPVRAYKAGIVAAVTYLGDRSYGRYITINHPESDEQTLYAHLSAASVKGGDTVTKGQQIGNVGDLGNATGPHLHFEIKGGTSPIVEGSGGGLLAGIAGIANTIQAMALLKKLYPQAEEAAWNMKGVHSLEPGQISKIINRYARKKIRALAGQGLIPGLSDTPEGIPPAPEGLSSNQEIVQKAMLAAGFGQGQWSALYNLVQHESGFNNLAQNPTSTAYGMFQFLNSTWAGVDGKKTSDPWLQAIYGMRYIKNRYKNPKRAWDFWQDNNWYGQGAVFDGAQTIGVGESGPEAVIPLNDQGMGFMANVMARSVGMGSSPMANGSTYNTKIDRSTNFTGPITVQAQNPEELIAKLQARQRVMALSRPTLTGSAA